MLVLSSATIASADILPFSWTTTGSFSPSTGLVFTGTTRGPLNTNASGNLLDRVFGNIQILNRDADFTGTFTLTVDFLRPVGGPQDLAVVAPFKYDANVTGTRDVVTIDFPDPVLLSFSGSDGAGTFLFGMDDFTAVRVTGSINRNIFGDIKNAALVVHTPEPASILLLGTLFCAAGFLLRRKGTAS
jgi:hypothetical protein